MDVFINSHNTHTSPFVPEIKMNALVFQELRVCCSFSHAFPRRSFPKGSFRPFFFFFFFSSNVSSLQELKLTHLCKVNLCPHPAPQFLYLSPYIYSKDTDSLEQRVVILPVKCKVYIFPILQAVYYLTTIQLCHYGIKAAVDRI